MGKIAFPGKAKLANREARVGRLDLPLNRKALPPETGAHEAMTRRKKKKKNKAMDNKPSMVNDSDPSLLVQLWKSRYQATT